jgi:ribosomal protein S18 acetylase RimI-like enzyme
METPIIQREEHITQGLLAAFERLVPQLTTRAPPPTKAHLQEMVVNPWCSLFTARLPDGEIAGLLTLITYLTPTGVRAVIEDVVVDKDVRGRGIGRALTRAAMEQAKRQGAKYVSLTSRPAREAANQLYRTMGFETPGTNYYRYYFKQQDKNQ